MPSVSFRAVSARHAAQCPALGQAICTVCCGTKRLVEIDCPDDCAYLTTRASIRRRVVKRQQERDVAVLMPTIRHLTERQYQLFFLFQTLIARHKPEGFSRLVDDDVAEAAAALAATLETAARGVIYEHTAGVAAGQRLASELRTHAGARCAQHGATRLRPRSGRSCCGAIEQGARDARHAGRRTSTALSRR